MDIIKLCLTWDKPEYGKPWMVKLADIRSLWSDYLLLIHIEAELDNIPQARKCLQEAKSLHNTQPNELLCLNAIRDMEKYWYQIETVKKVLRYFHGRVLLCDEVGLGKTIEAGMLIK